MKLQPMTDYVLEQNKKSDSMGNSFWKCLNYANFLKQPLKLGMFVPCDEYDVHLEKCAECLDSYNLICETHKIEFEQAKERVLFKGFELLNDELFINGKLFWVGKFDGNETVEDLIPINIILTDYAIKQLNL